LSKVTTLISQFYNLNNKNKNKFILDLFYFQSTNNLVYKKYIQLLNIKPESINNIIDIPFLPISFYKNYKIITGNFKPKKIFESSGTTTSIKSKHLIADINLYNYNLNKCFSFFYNKPSNYVFLALMPSAIENPKSSLIHMVNYFINNSNYQESGFYLNNNEKLIENIENIKQSNKKCIIIGLSYALLDFAEKNKIELNNNFIIMETGGMKGKRKEITRNELHDILKKAFSINSIHSEYGMTELLSQAYSKGNGIFSCPPSMQVLIRDLYDPFSYLKIGATGAINIIDLCNIYTCSFIETEDIGRIIKHDKNISFEVLGRVSNSNIRGCNLMH